MYNQQEPEKKEKIYKHDPLLLFVCFLVGSIIGYLLTHQIALLGT